MLYILGILLKTTVNIVDTAETLLKKIIPMNINLRTNTQTDRNTHVDPHVGNRIDTNNLIQNQSFNDRIIHYLSECYVSSSTDLNLQDNELSVYGRVGWRAITRTCRKHHCTFILPSLFINIKDIRLLNLNLSRNELDDGDAVLIADVSYFN